MANNLVVEFGPDVVERIEELQREFGEPSALATILRALGLMKTVAPYVRGDVLTIIDPDKDVEDFEAREIDLSFAGRKEPRQDKKAA